MLKIVLIDDEEVVLQGMGHLLQRENSEYEILRSFQDPQKAMEFIEENAEYVDVVVTDIKMPNISGVAIVKRIQEIRPEIAVIAMSAYTDYEYIRQAMKNGAADYLLKPCKRQEIFSLFQKVEMWKEKRMREEKIKNCTLFLQSVLRGSANDEKLNSSLWQEQAKVGCVLYVGGQKTIEQRERIARLRGGGDSVVLPNGDDIWLFSEVGDMKKEDTGAIASESFLRIEEEFFWTREELEKTIRKIERKKECLVFNEKRSDITPLQWEELLSETGIQIEEYLSFGRIEQAVLKGREDQLQLIFKESVRKFRGKDPGWEPEQLKRELVRFCCLLEERLKTEDKGRFLERFSEQENILMGIRRSATLTEVLENVRAYLLEVLSAFQEQKKVPSYIRLAVAYMEANYMQELSLQAVADHIVLNPWYFSSQFKKFMGVPMGEYLNKIRIDASIRLMQESDLKLGEIAELVGFRNLAYYGSVFKKFKNVSPKEYRMMFLKK